MDQETNQERVPHEIAINPFWAERNFLVLPFFVLDKDSDVQVIEYGSTLRENNQNLAFQWSVYSTVLGMPKAFDWQVHRAVEEVLSELPLPISNPIAFSMYKLIEYIGIPHSGYSYSRIRESLLRIMGTLIKSQAAFYSKVKEERITDAFHLYERVVFKSDRLDDGVVADTNYLWLGSWYLDNINQRYSKPLDRHYYRSLGRPVSKRIYEITGVKFFGLPDPQTPLRQNYLEFCQLMGIKPQQYLSWAKRILAPAHEELIQTRFLAQAEWLKEGKQPHEWFILYTMGERAIAEIAQARAGTHLPPRVRTKAISAQKSIGEDQTKEKHPLVVDLVKREVLLKVAKQLVEQFAEDKIRQVIEYTDWYVTASNRVRKVGAYITRLIRDPDFTVSADFLRAKASEEESEKHQVLLDQTHAIREERLQYALRIWSDDRYLEYQLEQMRERHRLMGQWVQKTPVEVEAEAEKIRSRLPKDEQERIEVLQQYEYYQVKAILRELTSNEENQPPPFLLSTQNTAEEAGLASQEAETEAAPPSQLSFLDIDTIRQ